MYLPLFLTAPCSAMAYHHDSRRIFVGQDNGAIMVCCCDFSSECKLKLVRLSVSTRQLLAADDLFSFPLWNAATTKWLNFLAVHLRCTWEGCK